MNGVLVRILSAWKTKGSTVAYPSYKQGHLPGQKRWTADHLQQTRSNESILFEIVHRVDLIC